MLKKRVKYKENLIVQLTEKSKEAAATNNDLKTSIHQVEMEGRHHEYKLNDLKQDKKVLETSIREIGDEKLHMTEQISTLRRLLAKTEDEKEKCFGELSHLQDELEAEKSHRARMMENEQTNRKQKLAMDELKNQIETLRDELDLEKQRRQRLETLYNKRDEQVTQLRSTFDQSLNTITKDTKNIKNILGKSLQKIDRQIMQNEGLVSDSDVTENDADSYRATSYPKNKFNSEKYLNLSSNQRTKSFEFESSMDAHTDRLKSHSSHSTPLRYYQSSRSPTSSVLLPSSKPIDHEPPTRDISAKARRSKRLTR